MQRSYFLGGASPNGFETMFWEAQKDCYGFYLKGGPGTGKSTLMKKLASAFAGENVSVYHCASDPHSLDAVVFEDRGVFVADATAPHEASTPLPFVTGELIDLAEGLSAARLQTEQAETHALYQANQAAHLQARKGLTGIGAMEDLIAGIGADALLTDKLAGYADRFAKRVLPKKSGVPGTLLHRQSSAVTPLGKLYYIPEDYDVVLLHDNGLIASTALLSILADKAVQAGVCCEVTHSLMQKHRPIIHVLLPEQKLAVIAVSALSESALPNPVSVLHMQRFYQQDVLRKQRSLLRFCSRTAASVEAQTIDILAGALRIHDELETHYIGALNPAFLDEKAAELITRIQQYPCNS